MAAIYLGLLQTAQYSQLQVYYISSLNAGYNLPARGSAVLLLSVLCFHLECHGQVTWQSLALCIEAPLEGSWSLEQYLGGHLGQSLGSPAASCSLSLPTVAFLLATDWKSWAQATMA